MIKKSRRGAELPDDEQNGTLTQYGVWGIATLVGVVAVALAAASGSGGSRIAALNGRDVVTARAPDTQPSVIIKTDPSLVSETQRLSEQVRQMASERDVLAKRLEQLEKTLGDVTASIPARAPAPAADASTADPGNTGSVKPDVAVREPAKPDATPRDIAKASPTIPNPALPRGRTNGTDIAALESTGTKTEFGVDLGGETSVEALRAMWTSIRTSHRALIEGLRPVVLVRDGPRPGTVELRLIAGPLANAANAARLCAALSTSGVVCQPAPFDGQRLALK